MDAVTPPPDDAARWAAVPPPWIVSPGLAPDAWPARQGALEPYMVHDFAPFWSALAPVERAAYLAHWRASPEWRAHLALGDESDAQATDDDAREGEAHLVAWRAARDAGRAARPWWRTLLGG